jgi:hypothetical protein
LKFDHATFERQTVSTEVRFSQKRRPLNLCSFHCTLFMSPLPNKSYPENREISLRSIKRRTTMARDAP